MKAIILEQIEKAWSSMQSLERRMCERGKIDSFFITVAIWVPLRPTSK